MKGTAVSATARRPAPRLRVGVISAGRVGAVMGAALRRVGHEVVAVSAVSQASQRRAEELLPGVPIAQPDVVASDADLVLLAVPDDELPGLVSGLVATGSLRSGQIVSHTSGAHGVGVLESAADLGALTMSLHPVMTFTGRSEDLERLASACISLTASAAPEQEAAWHVGEALALELGMEPVRVAEEFRPLYHAALVMGANYLITLVNESAELLRAAEIDQPQRVLAPLLSAALDNALRHGDRGATGPVSRGDSGTVRRHLEELAAVNPDVVPSYVQLARRTAARAQGAGLLRADSAEQLYDVLDQEWS